LKQLILSVDFFLIYFFWEDVWDTLLFFNFFISDIFSFVIDNVASYIFLFLQLDWFLKYLFDEIYEDDSSWIGVSI
jgi:hypothetical protein